MKIGFTGTQEGMSLYQLEQLRDLLKKLHSPMAAFHHGDCVGADSEAHIIARTAGYWMVGHPPINNMKQAHCAFNEMREKKDYLVRNRDIVNETQTLIAAPFTDEEVIRSGTWSTVRYARRLGRKIVILRREKT